ncbi:MAG: nucleoside recognition domain-containing protein [Phascolarctobacterium sp.]|nr:nucleoside recognition domain-containing protein [Phascolarctobacterium sp.]
MEAEKTVQKRSLLEEFVFGAKNGYYLGVERILPAMILAYVLILFLKTTGLMTIIGNVVAPVMAIFGLPGEAIVALISAFFAKAAGCATAATLYNDGVINAAQATILFPACITMGTLIGHFVRCVMASGTNPKHHGLMMAIPVVDALISMLLTRLILGLFGVSV